MKKISGFLAALLVFVATASVISPSQKVQAFSSSEVNYSDFNSYSSSKAGTVFNFYYSPGYEEVVAMDLTGWKAAICPTDNKTLSGAVATYDITNANKYINEEYHYAEVRLEATLTQEIPEGVYKDMIFDADGNVMKEGYAREFVNKSLLYPFSCVLMNNDGYAYAYVYSDNIPLNAATYPTFYEADKTTPVTSFNNYTTEVNEYGDTAHVYRLNILDQSAFTLDSTGHTTLYYKVGTPNVSVSGNDAANDGGLGLRYSDAGGFDYTTVYSLNKWIQDNGVDITATSPFDNAANTANDDEDSDDNSSDTQIATATVNGQQISASVTVIQNSSVPAVQTAINNVVNWTNQIAAQPAEVVTVLNQYAPSMNVSGVKAGGTLDITIPSGTDISAGARITFTDGNIAANVRSGDKVVVLHIKHDGTIEYLPATAGDGTITATFTSLSPVAWFKVDVSSNANAISPKTGESFWNFLLELVLNKLGF